VVGLSVDPLDTHERWASDIEEVTGGRVNFPLIADPEREIADLYGMIHPNAADTMTVRSVFVIGPDKKVKLTLTYPAATGRDFGEILRVIDSLQLTAKHKVATPADWRQGEDVIITTRGLRRGRRGAVSGLHRVKPYLRTTPQPK
jgi:alkyl hydroperoxide reductase subunit AhpC